ncbi:hypothetical protein Zm00014a_033569, partial [Zea mays]
RAGRGRARPQPPGRGARGRGARERERRRRPPPPPPGGGKGRRRGGETEGGGAPPPGKVRGEWERLCTDEKTKKRRNPRCNNGSFSPGKKTLAKAERKSIDCRRLGDPIDETNTAVPSDSADDARIGSNCSPELSPELEPPRTSTSNTGS